MCSDIAEPSQKKIQILLVWLVPVIMATLVLALCNENGTRRARQYPQDDFDMDIGDILDVANEAGDISSSIDFSPD